LAPGCRWSGCPSATSRGISARRHVQPLVPASRAVQRVPANAQRPRACKLGTQCRRAARFHAKGSIGL